MKITSKGQVTIPQEIREKLGLLPDTEVEFELSGKVLRLRKVKGGARRGKRLVSRMRGRGKGSLGLSTDQILALTREAP